MVKVSVVPPVDGPEALRAPRWRTCISGGILAALLFLAVWVPNHPSRPLLPTDDLYTHLSVARHLARGEGFRTDMTYPLSFAFPFARELPQPLIHRQPGFSLLLTVPYVAGEGYPHQVVDRVRQMQIVLLGLLVMTGTALFIRRGYPAAVVPWLVFLYANPLLVFAVDWGMVELACSLLLLVLWLRMRSDKQARPNWIDGLLAGALCMLRLDLFWVPVLWWILLHLLKREGLSGTGWNRRRWALVLGAWLLVVAPWAVRNIQVTGQPAFSLQTYAEHVKDTRAWPGYTVYRQLEPQPFFETMTTDPVPVLRKVGRGMKFFYRDLHNLAPLPVLIVLVAGVLAFLVVRLKIMPATPRRRRWDSMFGLPEAARTGPVALTVLTIVLLTVQYSFFDHSQRHLLVVLPVLLWEFAPWLGGPIRRIINDRQEILGPRSPLMRDLGSVIVLPAAAAVVLVLLFPCRLPGWEYAAKEAVSRAPKIEEQIDFARRTTDGVLFVDNSAVPWFIDRPVVWSPTQKAARGRICDWLGQPVAVPKDQP
ncbi:MAG: hypothetical protein ABFS42_03195 [Candidatus Krumholzibacteriota bacterium]